MFTGTLIEDLIATVERAEESARSDEALGCDFPITDAWLASVQENVEYDPKLIGAA